MPRVPFAHRNRIVTMLDLIYVLGTLVFFALMLAYVRGCQRLGERSTAGDPSRDPSRAELP